MSGRNITKGAADQSTVIRIIDATDGTPEQAVEHDTAGISLWYRREGGLVVAITPAALAAANSAHSDGGIEHLDDGYYRLDLPDAACATGVDGVMVGGAVTGMVVIGTYHALVDLNLSSQSAADLKDFADDGYDPATNKVQGVVLVDTLTTYTGNTPQTGDAFARLGAPAGASVSADVAAVKSDTAAILVDTAEIGAAGAGLTAVPWNAAWDAEVQSEVQDALEANNLDHLVGTATGIPAVPAGTYLDQIMDDGTAVYDRTTDSLQAIRDKSTDIETDTADIQARLPAALVSGRMDSSVGAMAANTLTASALAADAGAEIADTLLDRDMATGADSGSTTVRTVRQALRFLRNKWSISGTTLTVTKEDDVTSSWTATLTTTAGADPVTASDPGGP